MLVHSVFFWLKQDLSEGERTEFLAGLESLKGITATEVVYVGTPADTPDRPVIDTSYDYAITALLSDMAAHDAYQVDPLHKAFLANFASKWDKVVIYDID